MTMEQTLVLIKPDAIRRKLVGNVYSMLEQSGFLISTMKIVRVPEALAQAHYRPIRNEAHFEKAVDSISGKRVIAIVMEGDGVVAAIRELAGGTNPEESGTCTIRGKYGRILSDGTYENVIHASKLRVEATAELRLWFPELRGGR